MRIAALLPLLLAAACRKAPIAAQEPHQALSELSMSQTYRGRPSWDLTAATAVLKESENVAVLAEPRMAFYEDGKLASRLTSLTGLVHTDTQDVRLSSSVVATSLADRTVLRTEELNYSSKRKKLLTDKDVLVKRPGGTLRGRGLEANPDLSEIRIFHQKSLIDEAPR